MSIPLLFDLAVPGAMCTMLMAGLALRQEGGMNFDIGGRFQRWMLWTVILLTLPQFLAWLAKAGINLPPQDGAVSSPWVARMETTMTDFISQVVVAKLIPVLAAFFVLKATLDAAQGHSPIGSIIAAIFMLSISGTVKLMQGFNSGTTLATADMLRSLWSYLAGTIFAGSCRTGNRRRSYQLLARTPIRATGFHGTRVPQCGWDLEAGAGHGDRLR